jgi:type I restriction enzyme S subunit
MTTANPPNWPKKKLSELAEFRNGINYNKSSFGEGIKVVGVSDFQDYTKPRYSELEEINPAGIVTERNILRDGDIVFVRSNGNRELIGRSLYIERPPEQITHSAFTIRLRFISPDVYPPFYAYCFRTPLIRRGLIAYGGGTNISNLNQDILNALEVPLPSPQMQRRIAGILSAYDDLIENGRLRIRILETVARSLYQEWFVNFRFPGHDTVRRVPSALGKIPEGWGVRKLGEVITLNYGKALKQDERKEGSVPVFGSSGIVGHHDTALVQGPGIIVGRKGNVGSVFWSDKGFYPIDTVYFVSSQLPLRFLFHDLQTKHFLNNDSAVPGLNRTQAYSLETLIPPELMQTRFSRIADDLHHAANILDGQIQNLLQTRDLLLPRLLSGQVSLADGET